MSAPHTPRKRFGQHFLHDPGVIGRIADAVNPGAGEALVEIGPGEGALTAPLLARGATLHAIELDRDLAPALAMLPGARERLSVTQGDALEVDFAQLSKKLGSPLRLCGNLPYNISTPLLFHILRFREHIVDMHFMLQKEVVLRMAASPGSKTYGRLTVMLSASCEVEPLFHVGPGAFRPPPKVDSSVVRLRVPTPPPLEVAHPALFSALVRQAFSMRRKTLRNALKPLVDAATIEAAGIDPGRRPETLTPAQYAQLSATAAERQQSL
ncbi:MAG: 16S rRNA (adenine(1518)-N(6)/adenine(1519)-N(6))-dimethyltransferase RsmA [Pseudomonadota bacterium]